MAPESGPTTNQRRYRRARHDRGAETRQRLIEAALDVFGRQGFEGASTREIAKEANANLAAIVYHFGSKEALHVAVAEYMVGRVSELVGPRAGRGRAPGGAATPEAARRRSLTCSRPMPISSSAKPRRSAGRGSSSASRCSRPPAFEVIYR